MIKLGPLQLGAGNLRAGELLPFLGVPDDRFLELSSVRAKQIAELQLEAPGPPDLKDFVGIREVGLAILHPAAERLERLALSIKHRRHAAIDRDAAEVAAPSDPHAPEVALQRTKERAARLGDGDRRAGGRPCEGTEHQRRHLAGSAHQASSRDWTPL